MKKNYVLSLILIFSISCNSPQLLSPNNQKNVNTFSSEKNLKTDTTSNNQLSPAVQFTLKENTITLTAGQSFNLTDDINMPSGLKVSSFNFISSDHTILAILPEGKISALKEGSVTVKIELKDNQSKFVECKVNIVSQKVEISNKPIPLYVNFFDLNGEIILRPEQSFNFSGYVRYSDQNVDKNIVWSVSDSDISNITQEGVFKALKIGKVSVIASSKMNPEIKKSVEITIKEPIILNSSFASSGNSTGGSSSSFSIIPETPPVDPVNLKNDILTYSNSTLGKNNVFIFNGDGSNLRKLTLPFESVDQVSISPSENNIIFRTDGKTIRSTNIDGYRILHVI